MANWYVLRNGQTSGPYPEEHIHQWVRSGQVARGDLVRRETESSWTIVGTISEFQADLPPDAGLPSSSATGPVSQAQHQVWLAVLLSFLWPGIGQIYNKQQIKGILMVCANLMLLVITYVSCGIGVIIWLPFWVVAWVDAMLIANKLEAGRQVGEWEFF